MKTLLLLCLLVLPQFGLADEARRLAKTHVESMLKRDVEKIGTAYHSTVTLMAGHEFLKEEYGLVGAGARDTGAEVEGKKLIAAIKKEITNEPAPPADRVEKILTSLKYESLPVVEGDFATDPSDGVGTPDGKLHFEIEKGDVLMKVSPPKGDFILLHLRKKGGKWRVVSEYLD